MNYKHFMANPDRDCAIIAHRGIWRDAPENSISAIEAAIAGGHDVVEIDVRRSTDGELFLCHDDTLKRMTGCNAAVEELAASELATLHLRNRDGGIENPLTDQKLARLSEVFNVTRGRIFIHLDVKYRSLIPEVIAAAQRVASSSRSTSGAPCATKRTTPGSTATSWPMACPSSPKPASTYPMPLFSWSWSYA